MAEVDFWREQHAALDRIYERLIASTQFNNVLETMQACLESEFGAFQHLYQELVKAHTEAEDNVKFLSTLERHFKMFNFAPLPNITESMVSLLNGLRMVWVLSRHYNTDDRMSSLMSRIANELADRVINEINVKTMLRQMHPSKMAVKLMQAKQLLKAWEETYMDTRNKLKAVDNAGPDTQWEFDKDVLFKRTKYISKRLQDLWDMVQTVDQLKTFFGPELKKVIGDSQSIDLMVERVDKLWAPFLEKDSEKFHIFDNVVEQDWDEIKTQFHEEVRGPS
eukprot:629659-Rhodomonas_salina.1